MSFGGSDPTLICVAKSVASSFCIAVLLSDADRPHSAQCESMMNAASAVDTSVIFPQKAHVCRMEEDISGVLADV